jgi:hypothetical protein
MEMHKLMRSGGVKNAEPDACGTFFHIFTFSKNQEYAIKSLKDYIKSVIETAATHRPRTSEENQVTLSDILISLELGI